MNVNMKLYHTNTTGQETTNPEGSDRLFLAFLASLWSISCFTHTLNTYRYFGYVIMVYNLFSEDDISNMNQFEQFRKRVQL